jgi:DNA invertase Pin-like site-specific DNA recombinase
MLYPQLLMVLNFKKHPIRNLYLNTSNSSIRELLLAFFSYIANFQLITYSEDIKSGQKRALAQGKRKGRPMVSNGIKELIAELKSKNISNRNIARGLKISEKTVRYYLLSKTNLK